MEVKTLQPNEWDVLQQAPDGWVPDPQWVTAIVGMRDGALRGRMCLCLMPHIEGTWVHEDERGGTLGYRMEKELEAHAQRLGITTIMAYSTPETDGYLERLGFQKAVVSVYVKQMEDPCPQ